MANQLKKGELYARRLGLGQRAKRRSSGEGQHEIPNEGFVEAGEVKAREIGAGRLRRGQSTRLRSMVSQKVGEEGTGYDACNFGA